MLEKIENIIKNDEKVVSFILDEEDEIADFNFLITFENINAKENINDLEFKLEDELNGISVKTLPEQIDDQIDDGGFYVDVDFYLYADN
ncbi:MAG: hypothetical protein IKG40_01260 [Bacilli bacterium]|nr:hypothetical protein [Bacilli bacterium]